MPVGSVSIANILNRINQITAQKRSGNREDPQLKAEENRIIQELSSIDRKVRQHELAHKAAGGQYAGPPSYRFVKGPDGRLYAVAGEVKIDMSEGKDPEDTIRKMRQVIRAALAPADPSPQDRRVAAEAARKLMKAQMELVKQKTKEYQSEKPTNLSVSQPKINILA